MRYPAILYLCGVVALTIPGGGTRAGADPADADAILKALEANEANRPELAPNHGGDIETLALFRARETLYIVTRIKLIRDLWRAEPTHEALPDLMVYRWRNVVHIWGVDLREEVEQFAELHPGATEQIATGWFCAASTAIGLAPSSFRRQMEAVDWYMKRYPDDPRGAEILSYVVPAAPDAAQRTALLKRIVEEYPDTAQANTALGQWRRLEAVGEPFELSFTDRLSGRELTMETYRGNVVVIDFWATWCGPCVRELPHLKELYEQYHESGLEVIGISLDRSAQKLIDYCRVNGIPWPQYCEEGRVWDTELSVSWGVDSIPAAFIVDKKGVLRSMNARGQLDALIPELLKEPE